MNALKSGIDAKSEIIRREDITALQALTDEYLARFQPATPEQRLYVDTLIRGDWQLRRLAKTDAQLWESTAPSASSIASNPLPSRPRNPLKCRGLRPQLASFLQTMWHRLKPVKYRLQPVNPFPPPAQPWTARPQPRMISFRQPSRCLYASRNLRDSQRYCR